jgi:hypothetical protein
MFGERLFNGSSFIFRALAIPLLLFAIGMPLLVQRWTPSVVMLVGSLVAAALLLLLALANPRRFRWAGRVVCGMVFAGYAEYAVDEWFFSDTPFRLFESRTATSPRNALLGLVLIGLPALIYALTGRFSLTNGREPSVRRTAGAREINP